MNPSQQFVYTRTYSRWLDDQFRRELSWEETADRYLSFMFDKFGDKIPKTVKAEITKQVKTLGAVGSMRAAWAAGPALERDNVTGYNCSYLPIVDLRAFSEMFYILMCGTGVGFSVEKVFISQLPEVTTWTGDGAGVYVVEDSREGWANSLLAGLEAWFGGKDIEFDYSLIRPRGARLRTMGGRASGPDPLKKLHDFCRKTISRAQGRQLTSLEVLDICNMIADVVVVGGVRRSSQISFSDLDDDLIRDAKNYVKAAREGYAIPPHRAMSNNSAVYFEKPDSITFQREWLALAESGAGERGIYNLSSVASQASRRTPTYTILPDGTKQIDWRSNPCQPASATLLTPTGIRTMGEIQIGDTVWSGQRWTKVVNKMETGVKPVYEYHTRAGVFVGTENHRVVQDGVKIEVAQAENIDVSVGERFAVPEPNWDPELVMDGLVLGDGSVHKASNNLVYLYIGQDDSDYHESEVSDLILEHRPGIKDTAWEVKTNVAFDELPYTYERVIPDRYYRGKAHEVASFLRGLYSANGSICGNRVTLKASSKKLILQVQEMLSFLGIRSYYTVNKPTEVEFSNGTYTCRESYDLNISVDRQLFADAVGFIQKYKMDKLNEICENTKSGLAKRSYDIVEIAYVGDEEVFDITVDAPEHTYWTGGLLVSNCGEILLRPFQFCNLSEVIVRANDTFDDLIQKVKVAVWLGAMQSALTHFPYLRPEWQKNCEEERLLGVSLTGQMDNPKLMTPEKLQILKDYAIKTSRRAAKALGINASVAITTGKPSGTVSQLADCASGAHPRYARFYIRRYRISASDPLYRMMRDQGVKFSPENGQGPEIVEQRRKELVDQGFTQEQAKEKIPDWKPEDVDTWVVEFPSKSPKGAITRDKVSAIEQLEWYLKVQKYWCEHNQSITVYVRDDEWMKVGSWVYDHFDDIVGISFLPYDGGSYSQAPYEEITEAQYNKMVSELPEINYELLPMYEMEDTTTGAQALACSASGCELN